MKTPWMDSRANKESWKQLDKIYLLKTQYLIGPRSIEHILELPKRSCDKPLQWIKDYGDPREYSNWINWKRLIGSSITLEISIDLKALKASYNEERSKKVKEKRKYPWRHPNLKRFSKNLEIWRMLDEVYDYLQTAPTYINDYGSEVGRGREKVAEAFGYKPNSTFRTMLSWIKKNGDPRECKDWMKFKEEYNDHNKHAED